jgi:hypothetical protein
MLRSRLLAILVPIILLAGAVWGRGGATGAINGMVQDATGAVIPNAKVSIDPPSAVVAAPGPGFPAVGSASITSVVGTPRVDSVFVEAFVLRASRRRTGRTHCCKIWV